MAFRFYANTISQASKGIAFAVFMFGLMLIGIGVVIIAFPEFFAYFVAALLFIAGAGCAVTALKIYLSYRRLMKTAGDTDGGGFYHRSGQVHELEDFDDDKS